MERSSPEWDLDSDEIASVTSQDLHDNRPNRWRGSQSTWRDSTQEERRLWQSMKMLEDQDLAKHLYNAHALKRRGKDPETAQDLTVTMENGQQGIWAPPKVWTAWPLSERRVAKQVLLRGEDDDDDKFTFRKLDQRMPSSELQEEIAATILRLARERFHRRRRKSVLASIEDDVAIRSVEGQTDKEEGLTAVASIPGSLPSSLDERGLAGDEKNDIIDEDSEDGEENEELLAYQQGKRKRTQPKLYEPVVSSNDDLSYKLIQPSVRHILSQLDDTLRILHNARVATADYASDSSATDEESDSQTGIKRPRGRPRSAPQTGGLGSSPQPGSGADTPGARKRGRPKKVHVPLPGETHEEMLVRIARKGHRRLPTLSQDRDEAFGEWLRKGDEKLAREQALLQEEEELGIDPNTGAQERRIRRLGLRDWSDIVGAAAIAGFSPQVIARTAKRCANLFGEGMVVRRLDEIPASKKPAFQSAEYRPEKIQPGELDDDEDDSNADNESEAETAFSSRRTLSRQPSSARNISRLSSTSPLRGRSLSHSPSVFGSQQQPPRSQTPSRQRSSRSISRSSAGFHLCPLPSCDRSITGFSRRQNLKRHMQLVHPDWREGDDNGEDWDSDDEVLGAVHVDGFLKPILPTRGWRDGMAAAASTTTKGKNRMDWKRTRAGEPSSQEMSLSEGDFST